MATDSARRLHIAWVVSLLASAAASFLLFRLFPGGVHTWRFVVAFGLMASRLLVFFVLHAILMHRSWRVAEGSGALHPAKKVVFWLLAPTMVAGVIGGLIRISSMIFNV